MYVCLCQSGEQRIYRRPIPDHRGKAFNGLKKTLLRENPDGTLTLTRCCQVGGLGGTPYRDGSFEYYIGERCVTTMPKLPVLSSWVACNLANRIISHKQQNYPSFKLAIYNETHHYALTMFALAACTSPQEEAIDRHALVTRNNPEVTAMDSLSSLSVGNGEFAYTVDATGLQTFPKSIKRSSTGYTKPMGMAQLRKSRKL